jgi:hypothetical protein
MTNLDQIRSVLEPYLSDKTGLAKIPENLLDLLEEPDMAAKGTAELIEGALALYAGNRIDEDALKTSVRAALDRQETMRLILGTPIVLSGYVYTSGQQNGAAPMQLRQGDGLVVSLGRPRALREMEFALSSDL